MPPATVALVSALQSATLASNPDGTGDPLCADRCRRSDRHDCVATPWAKGVSCFLTLFSVLAFALAGSGYAKLPPTQQLLIKNFIGIQPGGFHQVSVELVAELPATTYNIRKRHR
jgi:hypothetical protein